MIPDGCTVRSKFDVKIRVHPDRMYSGLYLFGEYEPANSEIYQRLVQPGDTVFDVGANFGWYTALLGSLVGQDGRVHAFEPLPFIAKMTRDSIELNGFQEVVTLVNQGLGSTAGEFTVFTFGDLAHGHASATDLGRTDAIPHLCKVTTLDTYVGSQQIPCIDFMKIDVEGHELEVFKGGNKTLGSENAPIISFEINLECLKSRGIEPKTVGQMLRDYGYNYFWAINGFGGARSASGGLGLENCDYIAAKVARVDRVREALSGRFSKGKP